MRNGGSCSGIAVRNGGELQCGMWGELQWDCSAERGRIAVGLQCGMGENCSVEWGELQCGIAVLNGGELQYRIAVLNGGELQ